MASNALDINGRVRYIEPTNVSRDSNGIHSIITSNELVLNNLEDYCIAVDLEVLIPDRKACGLAYATGEVGSLHYSSSNGTISFMHGTNGSLTTNFTEVSSLNPSASNAECLGIESIDVSFDSWLYPLVTIKFVDVRGAAVMMPEEDSYQNNGATQGSLYRALFSVPFPMFKLSLKGFYGKGATFYLCPQDTDIELDSSSGNFNITVKFVGYRFRIYADLPMPYICVAPYLSNGAEYWNNKVTDGTFTFTNRDGTKSDMIKFPEFRKKIAEAALSMPQKSAAAEGEMFTSAKDTQINALRELRDNCVLKNWIEGPQYYYIVDVKNEKKDLQTKQDIGQAITTYLSVVSQYDKTYNTQYFSKVEALKVYSSDQKYAGKTKAYNDIIDINFTRDERANALHPNLVSDTDKPKYDQYIHAFANVEERVMGELAKSNDDFAVVYVIDISDGRIKEFLTTEIDAAIKGLESDKSKLKAEYEEKSKALLEDALGFSPSIQNIFHLAFAHMDTFMHCFNEYLKNIKAKMDSSSDTTRKVSTFGSAIETDVPGTEMSLPPFPAFYGKKPINGLENSENTKVMLWPGDFGDAGENLDEVAFVKDVLAASKVYSKKMVEVNEYIEQLREALNANSSNPTNPEESRGTILNGAPSISINEFIPVTTYDFINKDFMENPYSFVKRSNYNKDDLAKAIFTAFATRAIYYMSTTGDSNKEPASFGDIEAVNFAKALGLDYTSDAFESFIVDYSDKGDASDVFNEVVKASINYKNVSKNIFGKIGSKWGYTAESTSADGKDSYYPIGQPVLSEIQRNLTSGTQKSNRFYIQERQTKTPENGKTFVFFDARDYLKCIYDEVANMADKMSEEEEKVYQLKSNKILKRFKDNTDSDFDNDDFELAKKIIVVTATGDRRSRKTVQEILSNATEETLMNDLTVKYPTVINEDRDDSLFDESIYTQQVSVLSKAYLYLSSMPIKRPRKRRGQTSQQCGIVSKVMNGVELQSVLLREGSFYWRADYMNISGGTDPILHSGYKGATSGETYMKNGVGKKYETLNPIKERGSGSYLTWEEPEGNTPSRREAITQMFINWAQTEYASIDGLIDDPNLYIDTKFKKGFNHELVNTNANAKKVQNVVNRTFFHVGTVLDCYADRDNGEKKFLAGESNLVAAFKAFMAGLKRIYKSDIKDNFRQAEIQTIERTTADPFNNRDLRLATYQTLKSLYDKWLCAPFKGEHTWKFGDNDSEFSNFVFMDSFYRRIGTQLFVNASKTGEWIGGCLPAQGNGGTDSLMSYNGRSVYDFLAATSTNVGGILMSFPQRIGGYSDDYIASMFTAMPYNSDWETDSSSFVFIYTYRMSEHMGSDQYSDDGFQLNTEQATDILGGEGYSIPAFGVSYGKQNQAFFKNINLNTQQGIVTEMSINATMAIASRGSAGARETSMFGQDLYRVKTSYSYQCEFDMMGCIQVMPLMYFQLNNVPFWRGAYIVTKVSHQISQGDMVTHVTGVRINRNALPMTDGELIPNDVVDYPNDGQGGSGEVSLGTGDGGTTDGGGYINSDVSGNMKINLPDKIDFKESNITEQKPIISVWPAHGPHTQKSCEWMWSSTLVDNYIIPMLKCFNFGDGTSFADNIQRCNVDGNHTTSGGYSGVQTLNLCNKYGSKKVISLVPHWNGGRSTRHHTYVGITGKYHREDSDKFSDCVCAVAKKVAEWDKRGDVPSCAPGAVLGIRQNGNDGDYTAAGRKMLGSDKTDPAVMVPCACVLTENWFADYPVKSDKLPQQIVDGEHVEQTINYCGTKDKWPEKKEKIMSKWEPGTKFAGRHKLMQGWLFSEEGMETVAFVNVMGIVKYIETLGGGKPTLARISSLHGMDIAKLSRWYSEVR